MFDGKARFLDNENIDGERVCFATFPRSGNSYLRKCLEVITGVTSGSDMHLSMSLEVLVGWGMLGDQIYDDHVWVSKSHWPMPCPFVQKHFRNQLIAVVRNPLDAFVSMFILMNSFIHSRNPNNDIFEEFPEKWDKYVRYYIDYCEKFYDVYIKLAEESKVPFFFFRYEDMKDKPKD